MGRPGYNPPNRDCPACVEPSKTFYIGGKTEAGVVRHRWQCEHNHAWVVEEPLQEDPR